MSRSNKYKMYKNLMFNKIRILPKFHVAYGPNIEKEKKVT